MTVAALFEIAQGGPSEPGRSLVAAAPPGRSQGVGWTDAGAPNLSSSAEPRVGSFRASWQSLLASVGAGPYGVKEEEPNADELGVAVKDRPAESAGNALAAVLTNAVGSVHQSMPERAQQSSLGGPRGASPPHIPSGPGSTFSPVSTGCPDSAAVPANSTTALSVASSKTGIAASRTVSGTTQQVVDDPAQKTTTHTQPSDTTRGEHPASFLKKAKYEAASDKNITAMAIATAGLLPPVMPVAANPAEHHAGAAQQSQQTDLSSELPAGFAPLSSNPLMAHTSRTAPVATAVSAGDNTAPERVEPAGTARPSRVEIGGAHAAPASAPGGVADKNETAALPVKAGPAPANGPPAAQRGAAANEDIKATKESAARTGRLGTGDGAAFSAGTRSQVENTHRTIPQSPGQTTAQPMIQGTAAAGAVSNGADRGGAAGNAATAVDGLPVEMPAIVADASSTSNRPSTGKAGTRLAHGSFHERTAGAAIQNEASMVTSPALVRDPAAARTEINLGRESTGAVAGQDGPAPRETFAALDAGSSAGMPIWVHAGAQRAEAGFQDPALGWVGVRADASGGGVHAALVPGSAEAAQALGGHMAGLNAYLSEQHTPVDSLTLAAPEGRWADSGMGQGASQNMQQGSGQDMGQGASSGQQFSPETSAPETATGVDRELHAVSGREDAATQAVTPGGAYISVMA